MTLITGKMTAHIDDSTRAVLIEKAQRIIANDKALQDCHPFGARLSAGLATGPRLLIEDHNWIRLFEQSGDNAYSYRSLLLANDGDQVAIGVCRSEAFEHYCEHYLGLGKPEILIPADTNAHTPLTTRCIEDENFLAAVLDRASQHGELNIIPYMGIEAVWHMASILAERSGAQIRVAAPLPHLTRCSNDKAWFSRCIEEVLGIAAEPETIRIDSLAMLTRRMAGLARHYSHVAIKLTDSASSAGNIVFDARSTARLPSQELREFLVTRLNRRGWAGNFPLLLTAWESPVAGTPSVHLWIPSAEEGPPIVEGIFDQSVVGDNSEFNGASPTRLNPETQQRLATDAVKLAMVFQYLGYFGQCSFDAILIGENPDTALLHWVECNGRWGGVSIPLALANRLGVDWRRQQGLVIIEEAHLEARPRELNRVLSALEDELYVHRERPRGAIILSPGRIEEGSGYEIMLLDDTQAQAQERAERVARKFERPR